MSRAAYKTVPTSAEVWAALHARHRELKVFGSFSAPDGSPHGNPNEGVMFTSYGFDGCEWPLIEARTTWYIERDTQPHERKNERREYWLCVPMQEGES